jgi:hypothetical protein
MMGGLSVAENPRPPLNMPPFPPLRWDGYFWSGRLTLPSWRGFQARLGAYAARSSAKESDGTARLSVATPAGVAEQPPSAEQASALRYLLEHEEAIRDALMAAVFDEFPPMRERALRDGLVAESDLPALDRPEELKSHIGLSTVHILRVVKDGAAYVGFECGCTWDEEHGLGAMTHKGRIVELPHMGIGKVSGADLASEEWMAEEDARQIE